MKQNMETIFKLIDTDLDKWLKGKNFSLPELIGESAWQKLTIGDRVMAGNFFLRQVRQGRYGDVEELAKKDKQNRHQYHKR